MSREYAGYRHYPGWTHTPSSGHLAGTIADLDRLDEALRREVLLLDAGEASWPSEFLPAAINQLADLGRPLRGLWTDLVDERGTAIGGKQIAIAMEDDIEITRRRLLDGVALIGSDERGTIWWKTDTAE